MSDGLLPIGMFSRASFLSIKMLRAYHEAGILVPAQVDRFTGYRMYTADQLADAAIVRRLAHWICHWTRSATSSGRATLISLVRCWRRIR